MGNPVAIRISIMAYLVYRGKFHKELIYSGLPLSITPLTAVRLAYEQARV